MGAVVAAAALGAAGVAQEINAALATAVASDAAVDAAESLPPEHMNQNNCHSIANYPAKYPTSFKRCGERGE